MKIKQTIISNSLLAIITSLTVIPIISALDPDNLSNCPMGGGMMYGLYGGYGSGMMVFSWVTSILLIALIITGIYWLIKSANRKK